MLAPWLGLDDGKSDWRGGISSTVPGQDAGRYLGAAQYGADCGLELDSFGTV